MIRILTKIHHYRLPVLGACGATITIVLSGPGDSLRIVGPLSVDTFWLSLAVCGTLILSALVLGEYSPEDYGLEPQKQRR